VQVSKKLASSDFKNDRVSDPNQVSPDHAKSVKKFTKEYFDKAVIKHREHEQRLRRKAAKEDAGHGIKSTTPDGNPPAKGNGMDLDDEIKLTDDEVSDDDGAVKNQRAGSTGSTSQKRKRDLDEDDMSASPTESAKRFKGDVDVPPPPPPPQRAGSAESTSQKRKRDWDEDDVSASPTESAKRFRSDVDAPSPPPPPPSPPADSPEGEIGGSDNGNSEENYGTMVAGSGKNAEMALNEHSNQVESLEMMAGGQAGSEATSSV
jgi:histone-lysine N-methyltransferase SETD2